jgi:predicted DNA-binding protein (UPF0251 family)
MSRPKKPRNVCGLPVNRAYGPLDAASSAETVELAVDEFETIRLIDHLGLNQEECAERMGVARTTVQSIYSEARRKLAVSLVEGRPLRIVGGRYRLCEHRDSCCRRSCRRLGGPGRSGP